MIKVFNDTQRVDVPFERIQFPAGECHVRMDAGHFIRSRDNIIIFWYYNSNDLKNPMQEVFELAMLVDIIRINFSSVSVSLHVDYFPFGRQDRRTSKDDAFSLKVCTDFIKTIRFDRIAIMDPHSDVLPALLPNAVIVNQEEIIRDIVAHYRPDGIVAPDAGAIKKASKVAAKYKVPLYVAEKTRNPVDGSITGTKIDLPHDFSGRLLVCDDICDGGYTFIKLAEVIKASRPDTKLDLYVTHGLFTKGKDVLYNAGYDTIYTYERSF